MNKEWLKITTKGNVKSRSAPVFIREICAREPPPENTEPRGGTLGEWPAICGQRLQDQQEDQNQ